MNKKMDIYTFQSAFLKIHQRTTPKRMMADVLKNNFLEQYHLSEVLLILTKYWRRRSYGD